MLNKNWTAPGQWLASTSVTSQPSMTTVSRSGKETTKEEGTRRTWVRRREVVWEQKIMPLDQLGERPA